MTDFEPHRVSWTREKSSRFWNLLSSIPAVDETYFSGQVGDSLIRLARGAGVDFGERVLDFGCGKGHLVLKLLAAGIPAGGADFSTSSVERLRLAAMAMPNFRGAHLIESIPTNLEEGTFSTVFFVETIEHLLDDDLHSSLTELHRILRPGGFVVVTAPNDENLQAGETVCPDCGCMFHHIQHVRSWTARGITECMSGFGFDTVSVKVLYLDNRWWKSRLITAAARVLGKRMPNLVYVGRKRADGIRPERS